MTLDLDTLEKLAQEASGPFNEFQFMRGRREIALYAEAACNAVPELCARIRKLEAEIERREWFAEEVRILAIKTDWMTHLTDALHATLSRDQALAACEEP